jgi:hypothetical protein
VIKLGKIFDRFKENGWCYFERISWIVIVATALIGVPTLLIEHRFQLERDRRSATLEFAKIFQGDHLVSKRFELLTPWLQGKYEIEQLRRMQATRADLRAIVLDMVGPTAPSGAQLRSSIFDIVDFYETLQLCIENDRCDKEMAVTYFQEYAWQFYCLYQPYIQRLKDALDPADASTSKPKQGMKSYGDRLRDFATAAPQKPCS